MDKKCEWSQDEDTGAWETRCGNLFELIDGTPSDNKMKFCPYCGGNLIMATRFANANLSEVAP